MLPSVIEGDIDKNEYQIAKSRYETKKRCFSYQKAINKMENQYINADIEDKRRLIGSIFQNKIHFENKKVRTANVNPILNEISSVNRAYGAIKKWDKSKKLELSHRVTAKGFEPPTLRAEI